MKIQTSKTPAGRILNLIRREIPITREIVFTVTGSGVIWQNCETQEAASAWFSKYEANGCVLTTGEVL